MDIKDSYLHGTVGVVKSISVDADKLIYKLADKTQTATTITLPLATTAANGLLSSIDKAKLDASTGISQAIPYIVGNSTDTEGKWTGTHSGITTYVDGLTIIYVPKIKGGSPKTTLKINNLSEIDCHWTGSFNLTTHYSVGTPILLTYVGGFWKRADYNSDTTYNVVSNSDNGLAPKVINTNTDTVGSAYYVLASTNGSADPSWYKLPANAFVNDDTNVTLTNTTTSAYYRVLLSGNANDNTETTTARKSGKLLFNPSTGALTATSFTGKTSWGNIEGKPTTFKPESHYHKELKMDYSDMSNDARSASTYPSDYKSKFKLVGIKIPEAIGLTLAEVGAYATLLGWKGYSDNSGPHSWELASTNKERILVRSGIGMFSNGTGNEDWNEWKTLAYTNDTFLSTQIKIDSNYKKAEEALSIAVNDSASDALGKIEYKTDAVYTWYKSVTEDDTDTLVNKWGEIVNFLDSVAEGTDITNEFVTMKTDLTITGTKTFSKVINSANSGGSWISGMTNAAIKYDSLNALNTSNYHPIIGVKTNRENVVNFGAYVNDVGFYGYKKDRTDNGYDWLFKFNSETGAITHTGTSITANKFIGTLNATLTFSAGTFSAKTYNNSAAVTVNIPTHTSHLTNDSGFLTSRGYIGTTAVQASSASQNLTGIGNLTMSGNLTITPGNTDNFITFSYSSGTTYSWRLGYLGTGSGDGNYLVIQSAKAAGTSWNNVIRMGNETLDAAFGGNIYPLITNTKTLGTNSLKWANVYATTFTGNLTGNVTGNVSGSSGSCTGNSATATTLKPTTAISAKAFNLVNTTWADTGYTFASLATGTYAIQVTSGTNLVASGIMSVYKNLLDTAGDEIPLHVYGTAGWRPYLRTYQNKLLISSNDASATSRTVTIKIALIL